MGDDDYTWGDLRPGDSIVVPRRIVFESVTEDREVPHGSERVLVLANVVGESHNGLAYARIYLLSRHGVVFVKRTIGGDPAPEKRWYGR